MKPKGYATIQVFGGEQRVGIYEISLGLPNGETYHDIQVFGAALDEYSVLLGMDIIARTDFFITNNDGKTTFQFRTPSEGGVEL